MSSHGVTDGARGCRDTRPDDGTLPHHLIHVDDDGAALDPSPVDRLPYRAPPSGRPLARSGVGGGPFSSRPHHLVPGHTQSP